MRTCCKDSSQRLGWGSYKWTIKKPSVPSFENKQEAARWEAEGGAVQGAQFLLGANELCGLNMGESRSLRVKKKEVKRLRFRFLIPRDVEDTQKYVPDTDWRWSRPSWHRRLPPTSFSSRALCSPPPTVFTSWIPATSKRLGWKNWKYSIQKRQKSLVLSFSSPSHRNSEAGRLVGGRGRRLALRDEATWPWKCARRPVLGAAPVAHPESRLVLPFPRASSRPSVLSWFTVTYCFLCWKEQHRRLLPLYSDCISNEDSVVCTDFELEITVFIWVAMVLLTVLPCQGVYY